LDFINTILGVPLGYVIYLAYNLTGSYGLAIIAFAIIVKIVLFPIMILAHKNSIRLLQLQPALNALKHRFVGDKGGLNEAQHGLFSKERYNPLLGILPLLVQLFLIMGMLQVMYRPLQHMLRIDAYAIDLLVQTLYGLGIEGGFAPQLAVMEAFPLNQEAFQAALSGIYGGDYIFQAISNMEIHFLGLNLGATPSFLSPSFELSIILFSGMAALLFCMVQGDISPGALSQSNRTNMGLTLFTVGLSLYFAWALPVGVGLYWTVGNTAAIFVVLFLNLLLPPRKLAAGALTHLQSLQKTPQQLREEAIAQKELRGIEKADIARFKAARKTIVFYALTSGQYRYYKNILEYLFAHSDIVVHYLTDDPKDAVFTQQHPQLIPYYVSQKKAIGLMLKLDTDIMVTTVPDLQTFHMKRSIVRDDIEYIFIPHSMASLYVTMKEAACDHFDTILCVGPHQTAEMRRREEIAKLPRKKLIKAGYGLYDQLVASYKRMPQKPNPKPKILIAPSWQIDNLLDLCIDPMLKSLLGQGYEIIVRPHPQYIRLFPERMKALQDRYAKYSEEVTFVLDFSDNSSVFLSDILITDWSNIAFEFSYCTLKPCIFINTPMKIMNPNYKHFGMEIVDITLRDKVGISINVDNAHKLSEAVTGLLFNQEGYKARILDAIDQYLYHPGRNGEAGGKYIMKQLADKGGTKNVK